MSDIPKEVLKSYKLGLIHEIKPIEEGLIHKTYKITSDTGAYIIQKLHPALACKKINTDFLFISNKLKKEPYYVPQLIQNINGDLLTYHNKSAWRMQLFIKGNIFHTVSNTKIAYQAGLLLGKFHNSLNNIKYNFKSTLKLHDTKKEYNKMLFAFENGNERDKNKVLNEFNFIRDKLPKFYLPMELPIRVIHGDPKITNFLFDNSGKSIGLIDFDTCNSHSVLADIGDAFRSWCGGPEDSIDNTFNYAYFQAGIEGYLETAHFLTNDEKSFILDSIKCITLELAARFLADYFNDNYFGWDNNRYSSRKEHNLARCKGQIALFKSIKTIKSITN